MPESDAVNDPRSQQQSAYNGTDASASGASAGSGVPGAAPGGGTEYGTGDGTGGPSGSGSYTGGTSQGGDTGSTTGGGSAGSGGTSSGSSSGSGNGGGASAGSGGTGTGGTGAGGTGAGGTGGTGTGGGSTAAGGGTGSGPGAGDGTGGTSGDGGTGGALGGIGGGLDGGTGGIGGGLGGIGGGLGGTGGGLGGIGGGLGGIGGGLGSGDGGLLGGLGGAGGALGSVEGGLNGVVAGLNGDIDGATGVAGLGNTGLSTTGADETAGLGHLGDSNLITDVINTPTGLLAGDTTPLSHIPGDVSDVVTSVSAIPQAVLTDLSSSAVGSVIPGVLPYVAHIPSDIVTSLQPVLNDVLQPILPNTIAGLGGLETATGLTGNIGDHNLINDVVLTPGALLDGNPGATLNYIPGDVAHTLEGVGGVAQGLVSDVGNGHLLGDQGSPLSGILDGAEGNGGVLGAGLLPTVAHVPSEIVTNVQPALTDVLHPILPDTTAAVGTLEGPVGLSGNIGDHNLINDVVLTPDAVLSGNPGATLNYIPGDLTHTVQDVGGVAQGLVSDLGDGHLLGGEGAPLAGVLGGGQASDGLLNGVLNGTGLVGPGDGQGSHNLVTVAAGPEDANGGLAINALTPSGDSSHAVDVNAIQAPASTPMVANVSLLTDTLHLPTAGGGLTDSLSGVLNDSGASHAAAAAAPAPAAVTSMDHFDVGLVPTVTELVQPQHHALA